MVDEVNYKPTDRLGSIFARYGFWNRSSSGKSVYNNTSCGHCGGGCHGDGGCGGDGG